MRDYKRELESLVDRGLLVFEGDRTRNSERVWYKPTPLCEDVFFRVTEVRLPYAEVHFIYNFDGKPSPLGKLRLIYDFQKYFKDISQPTPEECVLFEIEYPEAYKQLNKYLGSIYKY